MVDVLNVSFLSTGLPSPPMNSSYTVQQDTGTLTLQWQPPEYGDTPVNYTITVSPDFSPGFSPVTTSGTNVTATVLYPTM